MESVSGSWAAVSDDEVGEEEGFIGVYQRLGHVVFRYPLRILWLLSLCVTPCTSDTQNSAHRCDMTMRNYTFEYKYSQDGDIIIGGIFAVHSAVSVLREKGRLIKNLMCSA